MKEPRRTRLLLASALGAAVCASQPVFAAVVATGTLTAECDVNPTALCCGTIVLDNATFDLFGTPVNLGADVGTMVTTDTSVPGFDPATLAGTLSGTAHSHPDASLLSASANGTFLCAAANPGCVAPVSFIAALGSIGGTVGLPAGISYTEDGTVEYIQTGAPSTPGCPIATVNVFRGPYAINGVQPATTSSGTDVSNNLSTTFYNSSTGTEVTVAAQITYSNVTSGGQTTLTPVSNAAGAVDSKFAVDVASCSVSGLPCAANSDCSMGETCDGYHAAFFDISTTATFSGPVTICGNYPDDEPSPAGGDGIVDGTGIQESSLRILHRPTGSNDFVDVTTSRDVLANVVCGEVTSFSPFVVAVSPGCTNASGNFTGRSKLLLKKINTDTTAGNDGLLIKGEFVLPATTSFAELDPRTVGAEIILANGSNIPRVDVAVPGGSYAGAGSRGWELNGAGNKWTFRDKTATPVNGIISIKLKDRSKIAPRLVQVSVKGKNGTYPIVADDAPVAATVVVGGSAELATGQCGKSAFTAGQCAFNVAGNTLKCKP